MEGSPRLKQIRSGYEPSDTENEGHGSPLQAQAYQVPKMETDLPRIIRSRYEPSDTENEGHQSPLQALAYQVPKMETDLPRISAATTTKSPFKNNRGHASKIETDNGSGFSPRVSPLMRSHSSKLPYKRRNDSRFSTSDCRRLVSAYKLGREELGSSYKTVEDNEIVAANRKQSRGTPTRDEKGESYSQFPEVSAYGRRAKTAPRLRPREKDQQNNQKEKRCQGMLSPLSRNLIRKQREKSVGELNEMIALKLSESPKDKALNFESSESISPGEIFFSRETFAKNGGDQLLVRHDLYPRPTISSSRDPLFHEHGGRNGTIDHNPQKASAISGFSWVTKATNSAVNRQSSGKLSLKTSKMGEASGKSTGSSKRFTANRLKSESDAWCSCMRKGNLQELKNQITTS